MLHAAAAAAAAGKHIHRHMHAHAPNTTLAAEHCDNANRPKAYSDVLPHEKCSEEARLTSRIRGTYSERGLPGRPRLLSQGPGQQRMPAGPSGRLR
jgi:hypothetical protein